MEKDSLTLKWGTLKAWHFHNDKAKKLLNEYGEIGSCFGAAQQKDTPRQKEIICELIDEGNFETVCNDWEGTDMTKEQAKDYVMNYGKARLPNATK